MACPVSFRLRCPVPTNHSHFTDAHSREWLEMLIHSRVNPWYSVYDRINSKSMKPVTLLRYFIKKYANRRLYDTGNSEYVTLNQVEGMIRAGTVVKAVDAKTGEDVTAFILPQIIVDEAKAKNILLPVPLLRVIIQYGDNILKEFFEKYLMKTVDNYLIYKNEMDVQFRKWLDPSDELSKKAKEAMENLSPFRHPFTPFSSSDKNRKDGDDSE